MVREENYPLRAILWSYYTVHRIASARNYVQAIGEVPFKSGELYVEDNSYIDTTMANELDGEKVSQ